MDQTKQLLSLFAEHLEKQDLLSRLTESEILHGCGYSEIHCIAAIEELDKPNVTRIANRMKMTRGAASKITRRLFAYGLAENYALPENKKEVYFRLTSGGKALYQEHARRHSLWEQRDAAFFSRYSEAELAEIQAFMTSFNNYLETKIQEIGGK